MRRHVPAVTFLAAGALALSLGPAARAHPEGLSVAINFAADEPNGARSDVAGAAGVLGTEVWNNLDFATGTGMVLEADDFGAPAATGVTVDWTSNNTWSSTGRGEENNTAPPGGDRNLMTGYLDTNADDPATVTVSGLDDVFDDVSSLTVYVYVNGGVTGRGGDYSIGGDLQPLVDTMPFDGTYVLGENYLVFEGVAGPSFTLTAQPTTGGTRRAPVNAIEVLAGEGPPRIFPQREVTPANDPAACPPNGRGPLAVTIARPLGEGDDPAEIVTVEETVSGAVSAAAVTATGATVADIDQGALSPVGAFGDHRNIVVNPVCDPSNGDTVEAPAGVYTLTNVGEDVWQNGDTFQFAYNLMRGDFDVEVHIDERVAARGSRWGKHGIMARQDLTPRSRYTTAQDAIGDVDPITGAAHNNDDSTMLGGRPTHGGNDNFENQPFPVNPSGDNIDDYCDGIGPDDGLCTVVHHDDLRLVRVGDVFSSYSRADPTEDWSLLGSHDWGPGAPESVLVGLYATSHSTDCAFPIEIVFDGWTVSSGEVVDPLVLPPIGVTIEWTASRQQLADGLEYTVGVTEGTVSFEGTAAGETIVGDRTITLACDTRVTNLSCARNATGGADLTWDNHPLADPAEDISIQVNGTEVATVSGSDAAAALAAGELEDGFNRICVVNASGNPTCCSFLTSGVHLADLVAGGDGTGTSSSDVVGISADDGTLRTEHQNEDLTNTGDNPQIVDDAATAYVDSVFIIDVEAMPVNADGVLFNFNLGDVTGETYNHVIRDVTHDIDKDPPITEIWAGGDNSWRSCVAVHAAAGITFDLDELRAQGGGGAQELLTFECFAGTDQCGGTVTLYAIASDATEILDSVFVDALGANQGAPMALDIPEGASYLTLAVGANDGGIGCDHGVFAHARILTEEGPVPGGLVRGDVDQSGVVNLTDGVQILLHLFNAQGLPAPLRCLDAADADDSGSLNLTDGVSVFLFLFRGGSIPVPTPETTGTTTAADPGDCGPDTTADSAAVGGDLGCEQAPEYCP